jgi:hypothetical protein
MTQWSNIILGLIQGLRRVVAAAAPALVAPARPIFVNHEHRWQMPPHASLPLLPGPVWTLLWLRLQRLGNRLTRLHDRWQAGTLPTPRPQTPPPRHGSVRPPPPQLPELPCPGFPLVDSPRRLPRGHGWLVRRIPQAGPSAGQLEYLLQQDHTRAFVQAAPQAGRLLRPLCTALGLPQPDWLKLPPRPRRPRKPRLRPQRPDRPLPLTHPDLKLRPYEIAAARYFIKKYGREG